MEFLARQREFMFVCAPPKTLQHWSIRISDIAHDGGDLPSRRFGCSERRRAQVAQEY